MLKKYLIIALSCSFVTGSVKTEETQPSYAKRLWTFFAKKMDTITQYGDENYKAAFGVCSLTSAALGLKLWLTRNDMVKCALRDDSGNLVSNMDELFDWVQKIKARGEDVAKVVLGPGLYNNEFISTTGESFTYTVESKLAPITSELTYKISLGMAGIIGCIALYSAYKLWTTQGKTSEDAPQENQA